MDFYLSECRVAETQAPFAHEGGSGTGLMNRGYFLKSVKPENVLSHYLFHVILIHTARWWRFQDTAPQQFSNSDTKLHCTI